MICSALDILTRCSIKAFYIVSREQVILARLSTQLNLGARNKSRVQLEIFAALS